VAAITEAGAKGTCDAMKEGGDWRGKSVPSDDL
jgi:hypothetical protein